MVFPFRKKQAIDDQKLKEAYFTASQAQLVRARFKRNRTAVIAGWALIAFGLMYFAWGLRKAGRSHVHEHESSITPWALFIVFLLGPCEALIPLFMYPAAQQNVALVIAVATVFGVVTLLTMLAGVAITTAGLDRLRLPPIRRYSHAIAGGSIALCGSAISFLGL